MYVGFFRLTKNCDFNSAIFFTAGIINDDITSFHMTHCIRGGITPHFKTMSRYSAQSPAILPSAHIACWCVRVCVCVCVYEREREREREERERGREAVT